MTTTYTGPERRSEPRCEDCGQCEREVSGVIGKDGLCKECRYWARRGERK